MNLIHRSIWNDQTGTFVAVSENTRSAGKRASSCTAAGGQARFGLNILAVSLMMACGASALAQPAGGVVSAGSATIGGTSGNMTITQTTPNVAINWQSFGIKAGESVQFVQPGSSSVALNRVIGSDPSGIFGSLSSNGKVFLVNPNGILFGRGASVNVGGLVASTLAISDANFMANNYKFSGAGAGAVVNQGTINAADGGYVALLGANVSNQGVIAAKLGTVALAAGNAVTLDMAGDKLLNVTVDQGAVNALVENGGLIQADGGQVLMTTQAAGSLLANAVNNTGVVQARTLVTGENGTIKLLGGMENGTMNVAGTLDASAPNGGNGGFIETSAAHVNIANDAKVTTAAPMGLTGTWLIDPQDFTIGAGGNISGATLSDLLVTNSVTISTATGTDATVAGTPPVRSLYTATAGNGDIHVNDAVEWTASSSPTTLTLLAVRDVNVNAAISATHGNVVVCCGQDVNVNAAITTVNGSVLLAAGRNVNMNGAMTTTDGNVAICAGGDISITAAMTLTRGTAVASESLASLGVRQGMSLIAGTAATGPGLAGGGGAVTIAPPGGTITVTQGGATGTAAPVTIIYNPLSYTAPVTDFSGKFTAGTPLTVQRLVFPAVEDQTQGGSTTAAFTGLLKADAASVLPVGVNLAVIGTGTFDSTATLGTTPVTFTGFTLAGANVANFALPISCCAPIVQRTSGNITAAPTPPPPPPPPPVVVVVPPVVVPPPVAEVPPPVKKEKLPETPYKGPTVNPMVIVPTWMPEITGPSTPPQLLALLPPAPPIAVPVVEKPVEQLVVQPVEAPPTPYLAPKRQPKQDRN
ncbi:MAG: filamentous hemagglutinin N-terminal domain-containing protein [Polaromonas sp.]|nr:filamentous hemagglutinin N-terminal domain-containing protein [Polaromonas sp.]